MAEDKSNWKCCRCGELRYYRRKNNNDQIHEGCCKDCRREAFGFDAPRKMSGMKDRKISTTPYEHEVSDDESI